MRLYTVRNSDTLSLIAATQRVGEAAIIYLNDLQNGILPPPGSVLLLPARARYHEVSKGETAQQIAARYGITARALLRMNPFLSQRRTVRPGTVLTVGENGEGRHTLLVNGTLPPGCPPGAFDEALPYLTFLTVEEPVPGSPAWTAPSPIVTQARASGVRPLFTVDAASAASLTPENAVKAAECGWAGAVIPVSGLSDNRAIATVKHLSIIFSPLRLSLFCRILPDDCYRRGSCLTAIGAYTDGFFCGDGMTECDLALLRPVCPPALRHRMFPRLPQTKRGDAREGRRHTVAGNTSAVCNLRVLSDTLARVAHDCYGGLTVPIGGTSHTTYAMLRGMFSFQAECETDNRRSDM